MTHDEMITNGRYTARPNWMAYIPPSALPEYAKTVWCQLANQLGKHDTVWPSLDAIMFTTGLTRKTVDAALDRLRDLRLVESRRRRTSNEYRLSAPLPLLRAEADIADMQALKPEGQRHDYAAYRARAKLALREWGTELLNAGGPDVLTLGLKGATATLSSSHLGTAEGEMASSCHMGTGDSSAMGTSSSSHVGTPISSHVGTQTTPHTHSTELLHVTTPLLAPPPAGPGGAIRTSTDPEPNQGSQGHEDDQRSVDGFTSSSRPASPSIDLSAGANLSSPVVPFGQQPAQAHPLPAVAAAPVSDCGDWGGIDECPESWPEVDLDDGAERYTPPARTGPQVLGLIDYFRQFKDHDLWQERMRQGRTHLTELEAAEQITWAYWRYVDSIQRPTSDPFVRANNDAFLPNKSTRLGQLRPTAVGGGPVDPLLWLKSSRHWESWLAVKSEEPFVELRTFAEQLHDEYNRYVEDWNRSAGRVSTRSSIDYGDHFGPQPWKPPEPTEETPVNDPSPAASPAPVVTPPAPEPTNTSTPQNAPAPKKTYTKEELAQLDPLDFIKTAEDMRRYLNHDRAGLINRDTSKHSSTGWWKFVTGEGSTLNWHTEKWSPATFAGFYWSLVADQVEWERKHVRGDGRFELPPFGKLIGQMKNLMKEMGRAPLFMYLNDLYVNFETVCWMSNSRGKGMKLNKSTPFSDFTRGQVKTIQGWTDAEQAEAKRLMNANEPFWKMGKRDTRRTQYSY